MRVETIKSSISKLTASQKKELVEFIKSSYTVFSGYSEMSVCPYCGTTHIVKNGTRKDTPRYRCRDCKKSFTYKTNSVLSGIQKLEKWNLFIEDFISMNISTIEETCNRLKISRQTAMDWRHKLLAVFASRENQFKGETIEFDETYFLISRKGRKNLGIENKSEYRKWREQQVGDTDYNVKIFVTYGRGNGNLELTVSHMGRTSSIDLENYFTTSRFDGFTAYTDRHRSYVSFFKKRSISYKTFISKNHVCMSNKKVHNQTVNAYTSQFKNFVNVYLHGVSTKYIGFYAKWFEFIVNVRKEIKRIAENTNPIMRFNLTDEICNSIINDFNGLELYRQTEYSFLQFLKINNRSNFGNCKNHYYKYI